MGYTTDFYGQFKLNKKLDSDTHLYLKEFSNSRRMKRKLPKEYGVDGEFYVDTLNHTEQSDDESIVDYNRPPSTQPGLWCHWVPSKDGQHIEWDGGEKFYYYVEWLQYIIKNFLAPKGYVLNGDVDFEGEDRDDRGVISVINNDVTVLGQEDVAALKRENDELRAELLLLRALDD